MSYKQNERNIVFLSELKHVDMLDAFLQEHTAMQEEGFVIISPDIEVEYALEEKGMPFLSGGTYRTRDASCMTFSEDWTASVFESKRWSFFTYHGVSLSRVYFLSLQWYISHVIYYAEIVTNVLVAHPDVARLIVFSPFNGEPPIGGVLAGLQIRTFVDVLTCIAAQSGKEAIVVPAPVSPSAQAKFMWSFTFQRALFGVGIGILNTLIMLFRRPRRIRVLASDYWKNLAPYANTLESLEIVLIDRKEAFKAGLSNIWKFRMRFLHLDAFPSRISSEREREHDHIAREFESLKEGNELPPFEFRGISLRPLISHALGLIVKEVLATTLKSIDDTYVLFERIKPHVVLVRATSSLQPHFVILAQVSRIRGVPSIEVQHGLLYHGPGSYTRRYSTEYMGVYGRLTQREMEEMKKDIGARCTPIVIGSPRFDVYVSVLKHTSEKLPTLPHKEVSFLCIAPGNAPTGEVEDSHAYKKYFSAIASALKKITNARAVIKFRPGNTNRDSFSRRMLAELFSDIPYTIAQMEPLHQLFPDADVVVSCYSTSVVEAMQSHKPVILLAVDPTENFMGSQHFAPYVESGALRLATTKEAFSRVAEELATQADARAELAAQGAAFLEREYAFDGHASDRIAELIRSFAEHKRPEGMESGTMLK